MKIYTRKGDQGETGLVDGQNIRKSHLRIHSYGTVDELNSHLGLLASYLEPEKKVFSNELQHLKEIQNWLFQLGSQLACADPEMAQKLPTLTFQEIENLEKKIDACDQELPALKNFILPGGHMAAAQAHICRTVARRAERICVELDATEKLNLPAIAFLNRLSDYFFIFSRLIHHRLPCHTPEWKA